MTLTEDQERKILSALRDFEGDYTKVARKLSISERSIQGVDMRYNKKFNYTPLGRGPQPMQRFIVAIRDVAHAAGWDNTDDRIKQARKHYDAGEVEIATGRDGFNLIMYAIPRREKIRRKPYFSAPAQLEVVA